MALEGFDQNRWILGLERVRKALDILGHPEKSYPHILVGGTNGKGSTCLYLERLIAAAGKKTGLTLSPHISSYTERFRIDGHDISNEELEEIEYEIRPFLKEIELTYFEMTVVIAAILFKVNKVDFGIFEVGLGGRLDASNTLDPCLSIITNISVDHTDYLGSTISEIAKEKAAIAREGRPLLTSAKQGQDVISAYASKIGARLIAVDEPVVFGTGIDGEGQRLNAAIAVRAAHELGCSLAEDDELYAIGNAFLPGRIERIGKIILDVAHNEASMICLCRHLEKIRFSGTAVLGILKDKDYIAMTEMLGNVCRKINAAPVDSPRSWGHDDIEKVSGKGNVAVYPSLRAAFDDAFGSRGDVVVTGSFYTVGEIREYLICKGWYLYG
jgi:dihydrofolate synthase/folylpolyglutamate synthase